MSAIANSDDPVRICVLLPCGNGQNWALPQACLAEVLTLPATEDTPPEQVNWRGVQIPVMDFGRRQGSAMDVEVSLPWRNARSGTGLVAVVLGLQGETFEYWGLALRGNGLAVRKIIEQDCEDRPDAAQDYALTAFALDGELYQVPDLSLLQRRFAELDSAIGA